MPTTIRKPGCVGVRRTKAEMAGCIPKFLHVWLACGFIEFLLQPCSPAVRLLPRLRRRYRGCRTI